MTGARPLHRSWSGRGLLGLAVVIAHLALLALLLSSAPRPQALPAEPPMALNLERSLERGPAAGRRRVASAPTRSAAPPAPPQPAPESPPPEPSPEPSPAPLPAAAPGAPGDAAPPTSSATALPAEVPAAAGDGMALSAGGCAMVQRLTARLQGDAGALEALRRVPASARSVANAIEFWDGAWASAGSVGGPQVLGPVRDAVVQAVAAAPEPCRAEPVRGPRLIVARDGAGATIVSLGSGVWAWKDLLGTGAPAPGAR